MVAEHGQPSVDDESADVLQPANDYQLDVLGGDARERCRPATELFEQRRGSCRRSTGISLRVRAGRTGLRLQRALLKQHRLAAAQSETTLREYDWCELPRSAKLIPIRLPILGSERYDVKTMTKIHLNPHPHLQIPLRQCSMLFLLEDFPKYLTFCLYQ